MGEGDLKVVMVTEDLGVVRATSRGARLQKSKHRMSLVEGTHIKASLVKGKEYWRLTNVSFLEAYYTDLAENDAKQRIAWSIHLLLRKLVPHDVLPTNLYKVVLGLWKSLRDNDEESASSIEHISLLNIVHDLGYLGEYEKWSEFIGVYLPSREMIEKMKMRKREAIATVNNSLYETHLS